MSERVEFFSTRLVRENAPDLPQNRVRGPGGIAQVARTLLPDDTDRETFMVIMLDSQNGIRGASIVTVGTLTAALCHPREVFKAAILASAASIVLVHNHPSGDPEPSPEDIETTAALIAAGMVLGIPVRDHVILGEHGQYCSLMERGLVTLPTTHGS